MGHVRACPECGKIVEWTRGKPKSTTLPNGEIVDVIPLSLECPEHGPFDNISGKVNQAWKRVERGLKSEL